MAGNETERVVMDSNVHRYDLPTTPSKAAGVPAELEQELRVWGCEFIQHVGIVLRRPQIVMACAQILLQRFYYRQSFYDFAVEVSAMSFGGTEGGPEGSPGKPCARKGGGADG